MAGKPVMVDFHADWCASCKTLAVTTLRDPRIKDALDPFLVLVIDLTDNNAESHSLLKEFNVVAPPTFLFFDDEGRELESLRIVGDVSAEILLEKLTSVQKIPL
jgi:thiol:disulfide interchange protein DsbD